MGRSYMPRQGFSGHEERGASIMGESDSMTDLQEPKWYVLFVRSNQEKRVAHRLSSRSVEHFLPCYQALRQWQDRRVRLEIPLFPGYVFVRLPLLERLKVLTLPNVVSLVGPKHSPSPVSEDEIAWIKQGVEHGKAEPHPFLEAGERVVISGGILAGMEGVLLRMKNSTRVVVSIDSISRAFAVEIDVAYIEPLGARVACPRPGGAKQMFRR
jgi:transcription antitermination factor NusG